MEFMESKTGLTLRGAERVDDHLNEKLEIPPGEKENGQFDLVFDIMIQQAIKCPKILRNCRVVCKSWNKSACSVLRQIFTVTVDENFPGKVKLFQELSTPTPEDQRTLPSPFRKIDVVANSFESAIFMSFIQNFPPDLIITGLTLRGNKKLLGKKPDKEELGKAFQQLLILHGGSITKLGICYEDFQFPHEFAFEEIQIECLKELRIEFQENVEIFLKNIQRHSRLEFLSLKFTKMSLNFLRSSKSLENIPSLEINMDCSRGKYPVNQFYGIVLPNLTALTIRLSSSWVEEDAHVDWWVEDDYADSDEEEDSDEIRDVICALSQWCSSLQTINFDFPESNAPMKNLPIFPNLRKITITNGFIEKFYPEKFPSLKEVTFMERPGIHNKVAPHFGVKKLVFLPREDCFDELQSPRLGFHLTIKMFGEQFPNVEEFHCDVPESMKMYTSSTAIQIIHSSFPKLKDLRLNWEKAVSPLCFGRGDESDEDWPGNSGNSKDRALLAFLTNCPY